MDSMFKEINHQSSLQQALAGLISFSKPTDWVPYYNFKAMRVPEEIMNKDALLQDLATKRKYQGGLLQISPNYCYNWHIDTDRNAALNMLVYDDGQSKCLFAPEGMKIVMPTVELRYALNRFYAFNTKVMHTVLNFTSPRYLFSLEFIGEDRGLTYQQLLEDIKELGYGS